MRSLQEEISTPWVDARLSCESRPCQGSASGQGSAWEPTMGGGMGHRLRDTCRTNPVSLCCAGYCKLLLLYPTQPPKRSPHKALQGRGIVFLGGGLGGYQGVTNGVF